MGYLLRRAHQMLLDSRSLIMYFYYQVNTLSLPLCLKWLCRLELSLLACIWWHVMGGFSSMSCVYHHIREPLWVVRLSLWNFLWEEVINSGGILWGKGEGVWSIRESTKCEVSRACVVWVHSPCCPLIATARTVDAVWICYCMQTYFCIYWVGPF